MAMHLFIGRQRHYDTDGRPERGFHYVALDDDPDTEIPCGVPVGATEIENLILILEATGRLRGRPDFEPPKVVECPGRSGFEPRVYEALSTDEIEWVRQRLRM